MSQTEEELTAIIYSTSGEVTRLNNNVMMSSTLCMSQVWICLCWKDNCPVCRCASGLFTQCTTGSSQRSISAMTRCHWRSEDDVAERVEPLDDIKEALCDLKKFLYCETGVVEWIQTRAAQDTSSQG